MTMSSEVVPTQYLVLLPRPLSFSRVRMSRRIGTGLGARLVEFVQNLVLNVSRKETKDILYLVYLAGGTPWTNYLNREAPESEKLYIRKSDKLFIVY